MSASAGRFVELLKLDNLGTTAPSKLLGHAAGALLGAVGHQDGARALLHQVARGQFAHLARAHQEHRPPLQRAEDLARQVDGHRSDGNRIRADSGLGAHLFGRGKGALQQVFQLARHRARGRATAKASFTWPRICGSPTTIESRLAATRNRCRTASWSRCS